MEKIANVKLVVADLDGTLLQSDKQLDVNIKETISKLHNQQILFTLASGRNVHIMQNILQELDIDLPYITNNGANIFKGQTCIHECQIIPDELNMVMNYLQDESISHIVYSRATLYSYGEDETLTSFKQRLLHACQIVENADIDTVCKKAIFKVVLSNHNEQHMKKVMDHINDSCDHSVCVRSEGDIYTFTHQDANKGVALDYIAKELQIDLNDILVFGDNYNDLEMFYKAGISVAMGNAHADVQSEATYVCGTNENAGVSQFLTDYILNN